ncbi:hypothetical protein SAMN05421678_110207 [Actinopolymorpha cephalotaxi]|uniref:DUF308 domain-containing protein n=1 Tax=Actinopolymorpha cephalotaxi TaxID=504797 RepID=A0A1I2WHV4_9ACTN|nr:hypothetical protein [Actinopolymorpha cephalotaxi]NYH82640.1 hypothetical protein [Actinopolymorpha cephalotaxi]SFG99171.1 hypothetical protein SAMN05421678_110207 [Actinopolymorpha cephalotaxi]
MRDNGLSAPSYVAIADLAPEVADTMLAILAGARVAAYADPCPPVAEPCREIRLPPTPCDRLYVDEGAQDHAKALLGEQLTRIREGEGAPAACAPDAPSDEASADGPVAEVAPAGTGPGDGDHRSDAARMATFDEDRLWAEIVAGYDRVLEDVVPRWPAIEDVEPPSRDAAGDGDPDNVENKDADSGKARDGHRADGDKARDTVAEDAEKAWPAERRPAQPSPRPAEDRFVPPPPPPLPSLDPVTKAAWAAMLGGPALLLLTVFVGGYLPSWSVAFGVLAFIGGFVTLVTRMKGGPPDDDDGAIV